MFCVLPFTIRLVITNYFLNRLTQTTLMAIHQRKPYYQSNYRREISHRGKKQIMAVIRTIGHMNDQNFIKFLHFRQFQCY